jgi:fatty-acyl-CoA synthase
VSWLPLYHDMGLIGCLFPALERPGTLTLIPPEVFVARPAVWLRAVSRYRATISAAPNFAYSLCLDRVADQELEGVDLSSWRFALNGAEPVTPRVLRAFSERFAPWGLRPEALTPVYGLSEATLAVTFSPLDRGFSSRCFDRERLARDGEALEAPDGIEIVSAGRPLPGIRLRIVDEDRNDRADARVGRVLVKGPSLMAGYLGQAEATARSLEDGWLDSGDLGFLLAGELYLTGRAKDVIILRGRNHSPHDLEAAVEAVEGVRKGCAVAVSHLPEGADAERLLLLVEARRGVPGAGYAALAADCAAAVRAAVGLSPDLVEVLPPGTLPRTSSRKLRRAEALRRHLDGTLEPPRRVTPLQLAGSVVRSSLAMMSSERGRGRTVPGPRRRRARWPPG